MIQAIVADQDPAEIGSICRLLDCERFSMEISSRVSTGAALLEAIYTNRPELVITNIPFADMTAFDVIRKLTDSGVNTHFLIVSEAATFENARLAVQLNVEDIIPKPTNRPELNRAVRTIVGKLQFNGSEYSSYSRIIAIAKSYIDLNFDHAITLTDIADRAYISPSYLGTLFRRELGMNYKDYLTRIRMREACRLLNNYRYTIKEVGTMVGYRDAKYFREHFQQHTGMTPAGYRRR